VIVRTPNHARLRICGRLLVVEGAVLLVVAAIHLAVIPVLKAVLARQLTAVQMAQVWPPFLLNHAVVGVLLIPLGVSTIYAGLYVAEHQRWAYMIALLNAATVMALPVVLFLAMDLRQFQAVPFLIAVSLVCAAAISMIWPLLWVRAEFRDDVTQ
jgi:hypothetical protein